MTNLSPIPEWLLPLKDFVEDIEYQNNEILKIKFEIPAGQFFLIDFKQFRHQWHFDLKVHDVRMTTKHIKQDMAMCAKTLTLTRKSNHIDNQ